MSGMTAYFIRRLMLVPITFFAITFMVYAILRVVPGGPIEQAETATLPVFNLAIPTTLPNVSRTEASAVDLT